MERKSKFLNFRFLFLKQKFGFVLVNLTSIKPDAIQCRDWCGNGSKQTVVVRFYMERMESIA